MPSSQEADCPACVCRDGGDSPMSIAANIAGILTFATAVWGFIWVYILSLQNARRDMEETIRTLQNRAQVLRGLVRRIDEAQDAVTDRVVRHRSAVSKSQTLYFWACGGGLGLCLIGRRWPRV